jgi:hypothetical protein
MNTLVETVDLQRSSLVGERYDLAFFASGYESRCTHLSNSLKTENVKRAVVWGFREHALPELREQNDRHFLEKWGAEPEVVGQFVDEPLVRLLEHGCYSTAGSAPLRVLIDITSMSRLWYAALINWFRMNELDRPVHLEFNYSVGHYSETYPQELQGSVVTKVFSLPGMEGLSASRSSTIAVLGLGFTPRAGLGVLERLQPESIFSFYAVPGALPEYAEICRSSNKGLLAASDNILELPLRSVDTTYKLLCELLIPFLDAKQITFIPMGPKPHVLASMLVACRFRQVGCLYASMSRTKVSDIPATGDSVCTRAVFTKRRLAATVVHETSL